MTWLRREARLRDFGVDARQETGVAQEPFRFAVKDLFEAPSLVIAVIVHLREVLFDKKPDLFNDRRPFRTDIEEPVGQRLDEGRRTVDPAFETFPVETVADSVDAVGEGQGVAIFTSCGRIASNYAVYELRQALPAGNRSMGPGDK